VNEMHVDGFRFDLAASSHGTNGDRMPRLCALDIQSDPVLANVQADPEAWDARVSTSRGGFVGDA